MLQYSYQLTSFRAKYPLALVYELMESFGNDLLVGYDIGCGFFCDIEQQHARWPKTAGYAPEVLLRRIPRICA